MRKHQQDIEVAQQALANHEAKSLRDQVTKVHAELSDLKDDVHKKHLAQIRNDILGFTRTVSNDLLWF
jgi:hypothetical protein